MKPFRVSIAATLAVIATCALGFMGLREGKPLWASLMFCLTLACLLMATLKEIVGAAGSRPGSIGFALFGWVYLATIFGPWGRLETPYMPQIWGVEAMLERLHPRPQYVGSPWDLAFPSITPFTLKPVSAAPWSGDVNCFRQSAHSMGSLLFGVVGLLAARWVRRGSPGIPPIAAGPI